MITPAFPNIAGLNMLHFLNSLFTGMLSSIEHDMSTELDTGRATKDTQLFDAVMGVTDGMRADVVQSEQERKLAERATLKQICDLILAEDYASLRTLFEQMLEASRGMITQLKAMSSPSFAAPLIAREEGDMLFFQFIIDLINNHEKRLKIYEEARRQKAEEPE